MQLGGLGICFTTFIEVVATLASVASLLYSALVRADTLGGSADGCIFASGLIIRKDAKPLQ